MVLDTLLTTNTYEEDLPLFCADFVAVQACLWVVEVAANNNPISEETDRPITPKVERKPIKRERERTLEIVRTLSVSNGPLTQAKIIQTTGIPQRTVERIFDKNKRDGLFVQTRNRGPYFLKGYEQGPPVADDEIEIDTRYHEYYNLLGWRFVGSLPDKKCVIRYGPVKTKDSQIVSEEGSKPRQHGTAPGYREHIEAVRDRVLRRMLDEIPTIDPCYVPRYSSKTSKLKDLIRGGSPFTGGQDLDVEQENLFPDLRIYFPEVAKSFKRFKKAAGSFSRYREELLRIASEFSDDAETTVEAVFHKSAGIHIEDAPQSATGKSMPAYRWILEHSDVDPSMKIVHPIYDPKDIDTLMKKRRYSKALRALGQLTTARHNLVVEIQNAIDTPTPHGNTLCKHLRKVRV